MNLVIEIAGDFCEFVMQMLCIHAFLGKKIKIDIKIILLGVLFIIILCSPMYFAVPKILTLLAHVIIWLYVLIEFKLRVIDSIIIIGLNILISTSIQIIVSFPIGIFDSESISEYELFLLVNIFSLIAMICLISCVDINKLYNKAIEWDKTIIKMLSIVFLLFFYLVIQYKLKEKMAILAYFICAIMIFIVVKMALDWKCDRDEMKRKSLELHMHELYGKTYEGMIENIRVRQHDFKNQLAAIYGMHLTAENFEELVEQQKKYCDFLMEESRYDSILTKCNDKILAGFLYTKFNEWEKRGVNFKFDISLEDSKCKLATYELIEISGILIDNAAEAEIGKIPHKEVEFILKDSNDTVSIISRNQSEYIPFEEINNFFKKGYSSKGENRGIGLYDVKRVLDGKGKIVVNNKSINGENYIEFHIEIDK